MRVAWGLVGVLEALRVEQSFGDRFSSLVCVVDSWPEELSCGGRWWTLVDRETCL